MHINVRSALIQNGPMQSESGVYPDSQKIDLCFITNILGFEGTDVCFKLLIICSPSLSQTLHEVSMKRVL